jgi:hypothetical protein
VAKGKFVKAKKLSEEGNVEFKGLVGSSLYFRVRSNSDHQVLFRVTNSRWMCDCEWSALHKEDCSHILAAKQWLRRREAERQSDKVKTEAEG